ncbi:SLOG family protein [Mycobacterium marinum]|uniref:SLOG family protein n=1 Tax=Mycobacterium marinum TaxID=1781 RepID=UPI001AA016B2|nr:SLOG family protein [Mycobacterium marinum]
MTDRSSADGLLLRTRRRILITGSREWTDVDRIRSAIDLYRPRGGGQCIIVHGDCPSGADEIADRICRCEGWHVERHPAEWERACDESCHHKPRIRRGKPYCPMAGHLRNQKMVDLGADVCLAFPMSGSRGTWDCVRRARVASIPVVVFGNGVLHE